MKEILIGMTENCLPESDSKTPEKVRNTLVNSIAANIFDTLKSNDDIAQILVGVLDPNRTDKEVLMKSLMSKVNSTLQESLLRTTRGCSLNSECLSPEISDSMRSSTISSSSIASGQALGQDKSSRQYDGFETAENDFVYESTCSTETVKYELGKDVEKHEVPITVHELSKSISVPICVEDWVDSNSQSSFTTNSRSEHISNASVSTKESISTNNTFTTTSAASKDPMSSLRIPTKIVTSLPPLPRSKSTTIFHEQTTEKINESRNANFSRSGMTGVAVMEPVQVKIKAAPQKKTAETTELLNAQNEDITQDKKPVQSHEFQNPENNKQGKSGKDSIFRAEPLQMYDSSFQEQSHASHNIIASHHHHQSIEETVTKNEVVEESMTIIPPAIVVEPEKNFKG